MKTQFFFQMEDQLLNSEYVDWMKLKMFLSFMVL